MYIQIVRVRLLFARQPYHLVVFDSITPCLDIYYMQLQVDTQTRCILFEDLKVIVLMKVE